MAAPTVPSAFLSSVFRVAAGRTHVAFPFESISKTNNPTSKSPYGEPPAVSLESETVSRFSNVRLSYKAFQLYRDFALRERLRQDGSEGAAAQHTTTYRS